MQTLWHSYFYSEAFLPRPRPSPLFSPSVQLFVFSNRVSDLRQEISSLYSRGTVVLMVLFQSRLCLGCGLLFFFSLSLSSCRLFCEENRALFSLASSLLPSTQMRLVIKPKDTHASLPTGPLPSASPTEMPAFYGQGKPCVELPN